MKRLFAIILFVLIISVLPAAADSDGTKDNYHGFYGLFEELTEFKIDDFDAPVTASDANKVLKILFNDSPFKEENILNRDLIRYLSEKCADAQPSPPLSFKDGGLIGKEWREYYSVLNSADRLYSDDGFLNSESKLTYGYFIGSLSLFEDEILKNCAIDTISGSVITVSLENGITSIRLSTKDGLKNAVFKNMDTKNVFRDGYIAPYSRNIQRDDIITVYTDAKGYGIYVKITGEYFKGFDSLNTGYDLYKGYVYYIDTGTAIIKDLSVFNGYEYTKCTDSVYEEFQFDENAVFEYKFKASYIDFINENLLDKPIYIICDKNKNAKYFNISE